MQCLYVVEAMSESPLMAGWEVRNALFLCGLDND